ncbi:MAG: hypothetical protein HQM08_00475 [Candidatus Riflebacteria bacterium]|nr:hypothetical protein [Candidatus Riflebacteria bacterium]
MAKKMGILGALLLFCFSFIFSASVYASEDALTVIPKFDLFGKVQPQSWKLLLQFNHPVKQTELLNNLSYTVSGKSAKLLIINSQDLEREPASAPLPEERIRFVIKPESNNEKNASASIQLSTNLKTGDGKALDKQLSLDFKIAEEITTSNIESFYDSAESQGVKFKFSGNIPLVEVRKKVKILPTVGKLTFKCEKDSTDTRVTVTASLQTGKDYKLYISGGLATNGKIFPKEFLKFTALGPVPNIHFDTDRGVVEKFSRQYLPVSLFNVSQIRAAITRIPPIFAPKFNSLTVFARNDAKRPKNQNSLRISDASEAAILDVGEFFKASLGESETELEKIQAFAATPAAEQVKLPWFLGKFETANEGFFQQTSPDKSFPFSMPINFRPNPETGGSFLVNLEDADSTDNSSTSTNRLFQISDLSITYRISPKTLLIWVTSLNTGKPVPEASIMILDQNDHRFFPGLTDKDGILVVKDSNLFTTITSSKTGPTIASEPFKLNQSILILAATQNDSAFTDVVNNRFRPFSITQKDANLVDGKTFNGHIFTERGVYRPGETVFWKTAIRTYKEKTIISPPTGEKVEVKITSPRGEEIFNKNFDLNDFGTCSGSFTLKEYSPLGEYSINVSKETKKNDKETTKEIMATTGFQVQKFEPPRHYVKISFEQKQRDDNSIVGKPGKEDYLECTIKCLYYTGGFVKNGKARWTAHLVDSEWDVPGLENFHFGGGGANTTLIESGESILDGNGELKVQLPLDMTLMNGLHGIEIGAVVLDVDSRPAASVETFHPKTKYRVGLTGIPSNIIEGESLTVGTVVVNQDGEKVTSGTIKLDILKKRYFYTQKRDEQGNMFYKWESGWLKAISNEKEIKDGMTSFDLSFLDSGDYKVQAVFSTPEGEFASLVPLEVGYSYEDESEENSERRARSPHEISLITSNNLVEAKSTVKGEFTLLRQANYALVTCERDDIFDWKVVPISGRHCSFESVVKDDYQPNFFMSVTVPTPRTGFPVYKSQIDANLPDILYGFANIKVQQKVSSLKVSIAPDEANLIGTPGTMKKISFKALDKEGKPADCEMAVCVVDEAILSLTGYITPVLNRLADFSLPLSVFSGDLRLSLITQELYKLFATKALTGGDMGNGALASDLALRKDFRPVAYWNPALRPDKDGNASIEFKLPDSMTSYRVYAVSLDRSASFGSTQRQMVVTNDFYIQPALPRFLTLGDAALFPISLNNKSDNALKAEVQVEKSSNVLIKMGQSEMDIPPKSTSVVKAAITANSGVGEASLVLTGKAGELKDAILQKFPVKSQYSITQRSKIFHFSENGEVTVDFPKEINNLSSDERKNLLKAILNLSTTQWSQIAPAIHYLLSYPYGCVEQTSSGIIPLTGIRKLVEAKLLPGITKEEVDKYLQSGINRLLTMQTEDGGFGYWPGNRVASFWGTQCAICALSLARDAGFEIPANALNKAVEYDRGLLFGEKKKEKHDDEWSQIGFTDLAIVNLAMNKKISKQELEGLMKDFDKKCPESQAFLLWADSMIQAHSPAKLKEMVQKFKPSNVGYFKSWRYSLNRENALALLAILSIDPSSKKAEEYAGALLKGLKPSGYWHDTLDTGWSLQALATYFKKLPVSNDSEVTVTVNQTGKAPQEVKIGKIPSQLELDVDTLSKEGKITLTSNSKNLIHLSLDYSYPEISLDKENLSHGFFVEKKIENLNGEKEIRVGDLVKVTVEFEDANHRSGEYGHYEYIALEDPLPAGLIAINSALKNDQAPVSEDKNSDDPEWYGDWDGSSYLLHPNHFEIHEDKVQAFNDYLWTGSFKFSYFARAICEGTFNLRPTRVSLMYEPNFYGLTPAEKVEIKPAK